LTKNAFLKSGVLLSMVGPLGAIVVPRTNAQTLTSRYSFTGNADGSNPPGLVYGTTATGGRGFGTVYKLDPTGAVTVLYTFTDGSDGSSPFAGLVMDSSQAISTAPPDMVAPCLFSMAFSLADPANYFFALAIGGVIGAMGTYLCMSAAWRYFNLR
jgi:uncharacterized repeat protein (TIGR03803 family)